MKITKRLSAFAVGMVMTAAMLPATVSAEDSERVQLLTGTYQYYGMTGQKSAVYYYSDSYFDASGKEKNNHLRSLSFGLASTVRGNSADYTADLLKNLGFYTFSVETKDIDETPGKNTIGTVMSYKDIGTERVIAVDIRGLGYGAEWAGNMWAGEQGDASGFTEAAETVVARIKAYEDENNIRGAKIWMTGYSRAGGVADLTGKYINEHLDEFGITDDDLYVYTFEAPCVSSTATGYENIHNVKNPSDIIPMLYPNSWGMYNSGVYELLSRTDTQVPCKQLDLETMTITDIPGAEISLQQLEKQFTTLLGTKVSREEYAMNEKALGEIAAWYVNSTDEQKAAFAQFIKAGLAGSNMIQIKLLIYSMLTDVKFTDKYNSDCDKLAQLITANYAAIDHTGLFTDVEYAQMTAALPGLIKMFFPVFQGDMAASQPYTAAITATLLGNLESVVTEHTVDVNLMQTMYEDTYYLSTPEIRRGEAYYFGTYPSDEELYDDAALIAMGFDETDISYLERGYDVTYIITDVLSTPHGYEDADESTRAKLDAYLEANNFKLDDCYISNFAALRARGYEPFDYLDDVTEGKGSFYFQDSTIMKNADKFDQGTLKVLYLGGEEPVEVDFTGYDDPNEVFDNFFYFNYIGRGDYALIFQLNETDSSLPDSSSVSDSSSSTADSSSSSTADSSSSSSSLSSSSTTSTATSSTAGKNGDSNPNTGAASLLGLTATLLALGAVTVWKKEH